MGTMKKIPVGGVLFLCLVLLGPFSMQIISFLRGVPSRDYELEAEIEKWGGTIVFSDRGLAIKGDVQCLTRQDFLDMAFTRIKTNNFYNQVLKDYEGYKIVTSRPHNLIIYTYNPQRH